MTESSRGASPSEAATNDVMDKFESWYVDFGEEAFNKISDREYVQDDCTDMRKVMREVAILAWLARTSSSGQGSTPEPDSAAYWREVARKLSIHLTDANEEIKDLRRGGMSFEDATCGEEL